jgi:hypothetical protein
MDDKLNIFIYIYIYINMCKENNFVGEFVGKSYKTIINDKGDVIKQSEFTINIKVEKVGVGAYKANINYYDGLPVRIVCGFLDEGNDELILTLETRSNTIAYDYLYFCGKKLIHKNSLTVGNNEQIVRSSKLIRII